METTESTAVINLINSTTIPLTSTPSASIPPSISAPVVAGSEVVGVESSVNVEELTNELNKIKINPNSLDFKSFSTATLPTLNTLNSISSLPLSTAPLSNTIISAKTTSTTTTPTTANFPPLSSPPPLYPRITSPIIPTTTLSSNSPPLPNIGPGGSGLVKRPGVGVVGGSNVNTTGNLRSGVRGGNSMQSGGLKIPPSLQAKMAAMASRSSSSSSTNATASSSNLLSSRSNSTTQPPTRMLSSNSNSNSNSSINKLNSTTGPTGSVGGINSRVIGPGLPRRRPGLTLSSMQSSSGSSQSTTGGGNQASNYNSNSNSPMGFLNYNSSSGNSNNAGKGRMEFNRNDSSVGGGGGGNDGTGTPFSNFRKIVDPSGRLNFASKAVVHADGVDFSSGASFKIKMDDFELYEELGKGNYGTVQKVWHKPTKVTMALKEIRLELDDSKLKTIITELDILHRATSPYIIDFYGAFFIESCVYYCMEYMDAGSLEKVAGCDVPEDVLSRVTRSMVEGLKFLKDELKIMHRDVKPTNVLINRNGFVKLCDFGVSGQLDRSLAKTNIGCQSYMAPERIKGESQGAPSSYTASSDVWSLGLSVIEFAIGHYPYPPETYQNVFAQLTAIVHGTPPTLPERYSDIAQDFVRACLEKVASRRPTYAQLMEHPFLKNDIGRDVDMVGWIAKALDYREKNPKIITPALA